jgi:hypothetical protein
MTSFEAVWSSAMACAAMTSSAACTARTETSSDAAMDTNKNWATPPVLAHELEDNNSRAMYSTCSTKCVRRNIVNRKLFFKYYTFTNCSSEILKLCIFYYGRDHEFKLYENQGISNVGYGVC